MDKNTIIGMLLMVAVVFGFMYLQQPSEEEIKAQQEAQKQEQVARATATDTPTDTLPSHIVAMLDSLVKTNNIVTHEVNLHNEDGHAAGIITVNGKEVSLDQVKKGLDDSALQNAAIAALRNAHDRYAQNEAFASHLTGTEKKFTIANDSLEVTISSRGAAIVGARLKAYTAYHTQEDYKKGHAVPVELIAGDNNALNFTLMGKNAPFNSNIFYFDGQQQGDTAVVMTLTAGNGARWAIRYALDKDSYMLKVDIDQQNMDRFLPPTTREMTVEWTQKLRRQEAGKNFEERNSALYWKEMGSDGEVDNLSENGNKNENVNGQLKWFSAKSQFFSTVLIADKGFNGPTTLESRAYEEGQKDYDTYLKDLKVTTSVAYDATAAHPASFHIFLGPNKYKVLRDYDRYSPDEDLKLTRLVSLGWTLFRWINTGIIIPVFNWLGNSGWSYGIIILVLTILLKLVLFPLTFKSYMSQAKMRVLQPDIKELNEKYPGQENMAKRQQKQMELFRQAGASPMGGCLPMLLQMPILIAMFWFFPSSIELRGQSFLWAPDLSAPDAIIHLPFSIPLLGDHLSIFCLLMTATNLGYTYLSMQSQQSSGMPGMKWMMYLMPIMFLVFFNNYAAGLSYYYFVSLLFTIGQTYLCRLFVSEEKVRATMAENAKKPKKKNGWMARMEEMQRKQQAMLREQEKRNKKGRR